MLIAFCSIECNPPTVCRPQRSPGWLISAQPHTLAATHLHDPELPGGPPRLLARSDGISDESPVWRQSHIAHIPQPRQIATSQNISQRGSTKKHYEQYGDRKTEDTLRSVTHVIPPDCV